jgi:hypothetical protein
MSIIIDALQRIIATDIDVAFSEYPKWTNYWRERVSLIIIRFLTNFAA